MKKALSDKDLKILDYLLTTRVATVYQIQKHLFSALGRTGVAMRLNRLFSLGYIKKESYDYKTIHALGNKAIIFLKEQGHLTTAFKPIFLGYNPNTIHHDLILTDIYNELSSLTNVFDIKSHNHQIIEERSQSVSHNISDLLFCGKSEDDIFTFALEFELSRKNPESYSSIFEIYRQNKNISTVLYLVTTPSLKKELLAIDQKIYNDPETKIHVALLDDFLKHPDQTRFHSWNDFYFDFQSLKSKQEKEARRKIIRKENVTSS